MPITQPLSFRFAISSLLGLAVPLSAQQTLHRLEGLTAGDRIGHSVCGFDNANGQHVVLAGSPTGVYFGTPGGLVQATAITTTTKSTLFWPLNGLSGDDYGEVLALGEPGTFLVSKPGYDGGGGMGSGAVELCDRASGATIAVLDGTIAGAAFGRDACFLGDVNNDGISDYALGSDDQPIHYCTYSSRPRGAAMVVSHTAGTVSILGNIFGNCGCSWGYAWSHIIGDAIAAPGDLTGDGVDDILLGSQDCDAVYVATWDATANAFTWHGTAIPGPNLFGAEICVLGDLNGDGVNDFAVGAPGAGEVQIIDGSARTVLRSWTGAGSNTEFGTVMSRLDDHDGDGLPELVVGAPGVDGGRGEVYVLSTGTGQLLAVLRGNDPTGRFGASVATMPDVTGDSLDEVLVGAPDADPQGRTDAGEVTVHTFDTYMPGLRVEFGAGCTPPPFAGPAPLLSTSLGQPRRGELWRFGVRRGTPGRLAIFALDMAALPIPTPFCTFSPVFPCNCQLFVNPTLTGNMPITSPTTDQSAGAGIGEYEMAIPSSTTLQGLPVYWQCYMLTGIPGPLTRGMEVFIQ